MIHEILKNRNYSVYIDTDGRPKDESHRGDLNNIVFPVIDKCSVFLLVVSPKVFDGCEKHDDWVRLELEYAKAKHKKIFQVYFEDYVTQDILLCKNYLPSHLYEYLNDNINNSIDFDTRTHYAEIPAREVHLHGQIGTP